MPLKKKSTSQLGKSIIRSRFKHGYRPQDNDTRLFTPEDLDDGVNMQSITQENDLDAFLRTAEMAGTEFKAGIFINHMISSALERLNSIQVIPTSQNNPYLLSAEAEQVMMNKMDEHKERLTIPRRPSWDEGTSATDLKRMENQSFLEWRRGLAELEEDLEMVLTPYERNLEVWRQLWRVIERSHVIVQIVDARNPLFFRSLDLERYVKEVSEDKVNFLLINKADYLSDNQRRQWAKYFTLEHPNLRFAFFSALAASEEEEDAMQESLESLTLSKSHENHEILNVRQLISYFNHFHHTLKQGNKTVIGLVGYPNVGKSSTINKLMGEKRVTVSSTPGKTKHFQTMILSDIITLCDCPGLVFPSFVTTKAEMVINGVLPIDQLREYTAPAHIVASRIPRFILEWLYGIELPRPTEGEDANRPPTGPELLSAYALVRGFRKAGQGNPDDSRAARIILKDYVNGKLLFCEPPPGVNSQDFNADTFAEGGVKFNEAQMAREKFEMSKAKRDAMGDYGLLPIADDSKVVQAKTKGKIEMSFTRVAVYPHQSGYSDVIGGEVQGKKSHKNGKRRIKDRSWRTE